MAAFAVIFAYGACVSKPQTQQSELVDNLSPQERSALTAQLQEMEVGRNMAGRLIAYYHVIEDEDLLNYLNQVGVLVASYSDFPERRFMFHVLNSETVNAFATPGGYILISAGALRLARNEAELATILGHEIAHVGRRHIMQTLESMSEEELEQNADIARNRANLHPVLQARMRPDPPEPQFSNEWLVRTLGGAAATGFSALRAAAAGMTVILEQGVDHQYELEADQLGTQYAMMAGYEPRALTVFLSRLAKAKGVDNSVFSKTHPSFEDRITSINQMLKETEADSIIGARGQERFRGYQQRLPRPKSTKRKR